MDFLLCTCFGQRFCGHLALPSGPLLYCSLPITTRRVTFLRPNQLQVGPPISSSSRNHAVGVLSSPGAVPMESTDDVGIHCELASTILCGHPRQFEAALLWFCEVRVAHHDLCGDSLSRSAADSGCRAFQCEHLPLQRSRTRTPMLNGGQFGRFGGHTDMSGTTGGNGSRRRFQHQSLSGNA